MRKIALTAVVAALLLSQKPAAADTYQKDSVIIPMDTTYQDVGMLNAYGLVYELLRNGVPVQWAIRQGKDYGGVDFTASANPYPAGGAAFAASYRGGPWLIQSGDAAKALPIITNWKKTHTVTVHTATAPFDAPIARYLVVAPSIAMFADGNQKIARGYLEAAGIPDSKMDYTWPDTSPDMLTPDEVAGPSTSNHHDGALFDSDGSPVYCQLMSMHFDVTKARAQPEIVAEVRSFLTHPTHFYAECQAVNAFENDPVNGHFLTPNGFLISAQPKLVDFYNADYPFAQLDGPFKTVGGSESSYTLPAGDQYKDHDIVMITTKDTPIGQGDVWMTGYLDGQCKISQDNGEGGGNQSSTCLEIGKVSYLGGHQYSVSTPISMNGDTQGARLFLNSLFEAPCATEAGQPQLYLSKSAASSTTSNQLTFKLDYSNESPGTATSAILTDTLPAGTTFVSATGGGTLKGSVVTWDLKNLGKQEGGSVTLTVSLAQHGTFKNTAHLAYKVGLNAFGLDSNETSTVYDSDTDKDGIVDSLDDCPNDFDPAQNLQTDVNNCGTCGTKCSASNATVQCAAGQCAISDCNDGFADCDGEYKTGCELATSKFADDEANCGSCGSVCAPLDANGQCVAGNCTIANCKGGHADCNSIAADGCEYDTSGFQGDPKHCGNCQTQCAPGEICQSGGCVPNTCAAGKADCTPVAGCETNIATNPNNCGGCGVVCAPQNASGACNAGTCTIGGCNSGFSDCNGLPGDGCEYDDTGLTNDPNNCGTCGTVCAAPNALEACASGACGITGCNPGFADCNLVAADGCEYPTSSFATDPNNCGGCGILCTYQSAVALCQAGTCAMGGCDPGFFDVDGDPANGCEYGCMPTGNAETDCNGVDDDCDGKVDEDYAPYSCGTGSCAAHSVCDKGSATCTPTAAGTEGPVDAGNCSDGADNDCDGKVDGDDTDCGGPMGMGGTGGTAGTGGTSAAAGSGGTSTGMAGEPAAGGDTSGGTTSGGSSGTGAMSAGGSSGNSSMTGNTAGSSNMTGNSDAGAGDNTAGTSGSGVMSNVGAESGDPGGCGCRAAGSSSSRSPLQASTAGLLLIAGLLIRRRRQVNRRGAAC